MNFIQYIWRRAEDHTKMFVLYMITALVIAVVAITYESKFLYNLAQGMLFFYVAFALGYGVIYKSLREQYEKYQKEQAELFNNIKDPK